MMMKTRMNHSKHFSSWWFDRYSLNLCASRSPSTSDFPSDDADVVLDFRTGQKSETIIQSTLEKNDQFLWTNDLPRLFLITVARSRKVGFSFQIIVFLFNCSSFLFHFCWFLVEVFLVFLFSKITLLY